MTHVTVVLLLALASCAAPPPPAPPPPVARPRAAPPEDFRLLAEVFQTVKTQYVSPVDEQALTDSCISGIRRFAAKLSPPLDLTDARSREGAPPAQRIADVLSETKRRRPELDRAFLVGVCLKTMVADLDRLSSFLDREDFRELQVGSGPLAGIGIELKIENGFPVVVSAIEGTPASRSDLARGDVIVSIDGTSTEGLPLSEVVKRLRGKPKSSVALALRRAGAAEPISRELTREIIRIQTVRSATTPEGYAYIRLSQFQDSTLQRLASALKSAYGDGSKPVPGIILDLRNSTGGLLNTAVGIAAVFLPTKALVVELKGRNEDSNRRMLAAPADYLRSTGTDPLKGMPEALKNVPLVVIVNRQTASGAEIVAAALQDHRRAKLVGEPTYGIGTIQTIIPTGDASAIKLTTAKFYRPNGESTEGHPVAPDVVLSAAESALPPEGSADRALTQARKLLGAKAE